jgi:hypothetical protein
MMVGPLPHHNRKGAPAQAEIWANRALVLPQAGVAACNLVWIGHLVELFLPAGELLHPRRARLAKPPHRTP